MVFDSIDQRGQIGDQRQKEKAQAHDDEVRDVGICCAGKASVGHADQEDTTRSTAGQGKFEGAQGSCSLLVGRRHGAKSPLR